MQWSQLKVPQGLTPRAEDMLARQIATQEAFRRAVETFETTGKPPAGNRFFTPRTVDEAINEALRRELFIRRDMVQLLRDSGKPHQTEAQALQAVHDALTRRDGHRDFRRPAAAEQPAAEQVKEVADGRDRS